MNGPANAGPAPIPSPCTGICKIDSASGWCIGCGRTLDEIARWSATDAADRDAVMAQLAARMASRR
ncbi:hypothetical protein FHS95_001368 [Sphingomonas naasensis]|uniref:DUF1289 domain-containing protein n=1 Tax=Sphingomonas naasensis TaxID=1344951 RepID=A0A4V3QVV8_9SPHN|nr:DUF1289 domain-containing protein [Sphingomonas naasensis]NIJ19699.1 hypothetical protein [Sphingomonas naasensis]TGX40152.1 DUF1289 domain-containing protein [Sphingomonas naasensis]